MDSNNPYAAPKAVVNDADSGDRGQLAGRGSRFGAAFVDALVIGIINVPIFWYVVLPLLTGESGWTGATQLGSHSFAIVTVAYLLNIISGLTIFSVFNARLLRSSGQTIGKRMAGIRIVRSNGTPADTTALMKRYGFMYGPQALPKLGVLFNLINILLIFRDSRQCGHDSFADTVVVKA
jgi:uncharacterized RDD family membrane protein YckC